jgi:hypothetical protein
MPNDGARGMSPFKKEIDDRENKFLHIFISVEGALIMYLYTTLYFIMKYI